MPERIYQLRRLIEDSPQQVGKHKLAALPSPWDPRDYQYSRLMKAAGPIQLPRKTNYRANMPPVFDQSKYVSLGTCVAAAEAWGPKAMQELSQGDYPAEGLSVAYLYRLCKQLDGIPKKSGTYPRVVKKVLQQYGVVPEASLRYSTLRDDKNLSPPADELHESAKRYKIKTYAEVVSPTDQDYNARINILREAIAREGPILAALLVYESFMDVKPPHYVIPYPKGFLLGGHAVCLCDYDDDRQSFLLRNTWGEDWADDGYAWLPYDWVTKYTDPTGYGHRMPFFQEAWTSVDIVVPKRAKSIKFKPGRKTALVDGVEILLDQEPVIIPETGRMMVPVRAFGNNAGYLVKYHEKTGEAEYITPN